MGKKSDNLLNEHLEKIKYRVAYKISESPRYKPLVGMDEVFDEMPEIVTNEAEGDVNTPAPENQMTGDTAMNNQVNPETPVPAFDEKTNTEAPAENISMSMDAENQVNDLQNEIIKHNIEAMKSIHSQLDNLNSLVQGLNSKIETLNADVEEVREPTNSEKLMNKTQVSYPYYFNLNDIWSGNWFEGKRSEENEKGIRKLPDGSFIADFDDLPQASKTDVQNSFNLYENKKK